MARRRECQLEGGRPEPLVLPPLPPLPLCVCVCVCVCGCLYIYVCGRGRRGHGPGGHRPLELLELLELWCCPPRPEPKAEWRRLRQLPHKSVNLLI